MKRLKKSDIIKLRQVDHVISENTILADIEHPFLVSYKNDMMDALALFFYICRLHPSLKRDVRASRALNDLNEL